MKRAFALLATAMLSLSPPALADDTLEVEPNGRPDPAPATEWSASGDGLT